MHSVHLSGAANKTMQKRTVKRFLAQPVFVTFDYEFEIDGISVKVYLEDVRKRKIIVPKYTIDGKRVIVFYPNKSGYYRIGIQVFIGSNGSDIVYTDVFEWKSVVPAVKNLKLSQ